MNILVSINQKYVHQLIVLLNSLRLSNKEVYFNIFILHQYLQPKDIDEIKSRIKSNQFKLHFIEIEQSELEKFPVYEKRYPKEIYFRLFAVKYLPQNIKRVLYLDSDIVVINSLKVLYNMPFQDNYFIATTHIKHIIHKFHEIRLDLPQNNVYVNTGVLLMNLEALRKIPMAEDIIKFTLENRKKLILPDQDILSVLYGNKVKVVSYLKYNLGERALKLYNLEHINNQVDINWVSQNTVIIHYYGRNKPWNKHYRGKLNCFYNRIDYEIKE